MLTKLLVLLAALEVFTSVSSTTEGNNSCPSWFYRSQEGQCMCGSSIFNVILCNNQTEEVKILRSFCLTSAALDSDEENTAVVGNCLYGQNHGKAADNKAYAYNYVNPNITAQDEELCSYLNREGKLCGVCKSDHYVPAYSYDFKCYKCTRSFIANLFLYLTVAYLPLTIFLVVIMAFHISVVSPRLHMVVLLCQIYTLPEIQRVFTQNSRGTKLGVTINVLSSFYGIWNLDFYRTFIPPICLPLNTLQVIALDYLIALYPLVVLLGIYALVSAHDKGYKFALCLWRPFLKCSARMRHKFNTKHSIIHAFATFILLSYIKFINTSFELMIPTTVYDVHGSSVGHYLYYDATVLFLGHEHLPYAILAILVLIIGLSFPLFLFFYPMKWFQKLINICRLNSPSLRVFVDCFQGYYQDQTDGGRECRYFSAVYPTLRVGVSLIYIMTRSNMFIPLVMIAVVIVITALQMAQPYKKEYGRYQTRDTILLMTLVGFTAGFLIHEISTDWIHLCKGGCRAVGASIAATFTLPPFFYFTILFFNIVLFRFMGISHCWKGGKNAAEDAPLLTSANNYQPTVVYSTEPYKITA